MSDQQTVDVYREKADYYASLDESALQKQALDGFLARLPDKAAILDVGCGPGIHAAHMQAAGHQVTAIDATPEFVEAAKARGIDARLGTFDEIDEVADYDGVWASFSLLHARSADHPRLIKALARALKPGGVFFIGMKLGDGEQRDGLGRFYSFVTEDGLNHLLAEAGLTPVETITGEGTGLSGSVDPFILVTAHA